jgi:hypothetical protein
MSLCGRASSKNKSHSASALRPFVDQLQEPVETCCHRHHFGQRGGRIDAIEQG